MESVPNVWSSVGIRLCLRLALVLVAVGNWDLDRDFDADFDFDGDFDCDFDCDSIELY